MKKIYWIIPFVTAFLFSCKKDLDRTYNGDAQIAFGNSVYSYKITKDTVINIPVQLISSSAQPAIAASITADSSAYGSLVSMNDFPKTYTVDAGRFMTSVSISIAYAGFETDNKKVLRLTLNSTSCKVALNYKIALLTITR